MRFPWFTIGIVVGLIVGYFLQEQGHIAWAIISAFGGGIIGMLLEAYHVGGNIV